MLFTLLIGSLTTVVNLAIQVTAIVLIVRHLRKRIENSQGPAGFLEDFYVLGVVLGGLFVGHLLQFATWALLFQLLGEFPDFDTAFYHSAVNFASLGYGDIVMSERWRLLGALEATNGVLMLSLSAGAILSVMNDVLSRNRARKTA
ncbi:MAG: ion channel [Xanthomonadales bacterium]|jgi:hypothetical protein|nr:ion channel [Xanthomonadales bacterium]